MDADEDDDYDDEGDAGATGYRGQTEKDVVNIRSTKKAIQIS